MPMSNKNIYCIYFLDKKKHALFVSLVIWHYDEVFQGETVLVPTYTEWKIMIVGDI